MTTMHDPNEDIVSVRSSPLWSPSEREEDCRPRSNGCDIRGNGGDAGTVERQLDERNDRNRSENRNHGFSARMVRR